MAARPKHSAAELAPGAPGGPQPKRVRTQGVDDSAGNAAQPPLAKAVAAVPKAAHSVLGAQSSALGVPAAAAPVLPVTALQPPVPVVLSASGQGSGSQALPDERICTQAAAMVAKYQVGRRNVSCIERGVDPINRDGQALNPYDVHTLAGFIRRVGCDPREFERCICVQICPGSRTEIEYNMKLSEQELMPTMTDAMAVQMTMTTLTGSHANYVNRCFLCDVKCCHSDHSSQAGVMSVGYLKEVDPVWAQCVSDGTMTTILSHKMREEAPEGLLLIMQSDNIKHGAALLEHSLQLVRRLVNASLSEEKTASVVSKQAVLARVAASMGASADAPFVEGLFAFAVRLGDQHSAIVLHSTVQHITVQYSTEQYNTMQYSTRQ